MKKEFKIKNRFFINLLISFLISFLLIISISSFFVRGEFIKSYEASLQILANSIGEEIKLLVKEKRYKEIDIFIKSIKTLKGYRITVIDENGAVLGDSILDIETMENHKARPEIIEALNGNVGKAVRFSTSLNEDMLYIAVPFNVDDEIYIVRTSFYLKELNRVIRNLILEILLISLISILISLFIFSFYSKDLTLTLNLIKKHLLNILNGKYSERVLIRNEEFKDVGEYLNSISAKFESFLKEIEYEKERINSILSSTGEVIFVLDLSGKITFANKKFIEFFNEQYFQNKFFWEVIKDIKLINFIKETLTSKKEKKLELEYLNRIFLLCNNYIEKTNEILYTIFDITSIKKFEEIKRDFVRDASHELKTPLTAIKGFVETIENEVKNKRYIEIIKRNIDRTINIINDLLTLSKLEEKRELEIEEFDFKDVLNSVLKIFEKKINEKGLKVFVNIEGEDTKILGDQFKIEQVLINLIDNAINYTDKGEIKIHFYKKDKKIVFEIEDTGIGIPKEHIERIFERFYTVDKSRSRKSGGTGLGLSIVKHIILLHKGEIEVESEVGKGTKFKITIPQKLTEN